MFWAIDIILDGGITFVLEAFINEGLAYKEGLPLYSLCSI